MIRVLDEAIKTVVSQSTQRLLGVTLMFVIVTVAAPVLAASPEDMEFFETKIRPVLAQYCFDCHDSELQTAGLDLTSAAGFVAGGDTGPLVSTEDPEASRLLKVLGYQDRIKMPPDGRLRTEQLADIARWVELGAPWPGADLVPTASSDRQAEMVFTAEQLAFWVFQPIADVQPPAVEDEGWILNDIDRFVLSRLEKEGLEPAPPASASSLLRRANFDLTGLPPTPEQVLAYSSESSLDDEVDRLLGSERYGERYGRHWLDVARYADSTGNDEDHRYPWAYRYRDYVIDAFNRDLPYDQFVREQIAGDLLPPPKGSQVNRRGIVATGFLALGPKAIAQQDKQRMLHDVWDEQVDVVSRTFMGLTVACARCHDHKFDPIPTKDYYGLIGMFASTKSFSNPDTHVSKVLEVPLVDDETFEAWQLDQRRIAYTKLELAALTDAAVERRTARELAQIAPYMLAAHEVANADLSSAEWLRSSRQTQLREEQLARWVEYLAPREPVRPHLADWHVANEETRAEVAAGYAEGFANTFNERRGLLGDWRREVGLAAALEPQPKPPPRPPYAEGRDRFYHEVYARADGPLGVDAEARKKLLAPAEKVRWRAARKRFSKLEAAALPRPAMACAVQEGEVVDQHVLIRGDYGSPGEPAPKVFPSIVAGREQTPVDTGSGRLELAEWLVAGDNPLTARVMMNRLWAWHFGEGLVRSPNNFGRLGERPSHPDLLDWLATQFMKSGWSVKAMHRLIMSSNVYRMSSAVSDAAYERDPENRLLARFPRRRLAVEEIRDALLQVGGSLDLTMGGTLQEGFGTDLENSNDRLSLRPEQYDRRTVYLPLRRSNLPSLLNLFDFGDAVTTQGKRQLTNVAPQALFMMNSPFVHKQSRALAESLHEKKRGRARRAASRSAPAMSPGTLPPESLRPALLPPVERLYLTVLNRRPTTDEASALSEYVETLLAREEGEPSTVDAWASASRILLSSNEFIYVD